MIKLKGIRIIAVITILFCFMCANTNVNVAYAIKINDKLLEEIQTPTLEPAIKVPNVNFPILRPEINPDKDEEDEATLPEAYSMRDDYLVFAQHQDKNGLCWNFAATMAASTTIMKATNEYYDFSELWTAITCYTPKKSYSKIGAGGNFTYQYNAMQKNGLMLESDLPYQQSYVVSNENATDYYDFYNKYANDDLSNLLISDTSTTFSRSDLDGDGDREYDINAIKTHLLNNGSLYLAFTFKDGFKKDENGVFALQPNQKGGSGNHAVSLIGWDDNYEKTFVVNDENVTYKGAFMILNSYTETNGADGISYIFYEDTNIYNIKGYRYQKNTNSSFYFYDKIESGYEYPISIKNKYHSDLTPQTATTKQLNVFYNDVNLEYSYEISYSSTIKGIEIYLDNVDVTSEFSVRIDEAQKRFYIDKENCDYGNYKILVRYGNAQTTDTYLNNFYVTHGLIREELEYNCAENQFGYTTGKDLEYYSFMSSAKNYAIYTNALSGTLKLVSSGKSVYSEKDMAIADVSYEITDGVSCTITKTITANDGYELDYNFTFIYSQDTSMQTVRVHYELNGGINNSQNFATELASEASGLTLYAPTREGYDFVGWQVEGDDGFIDATQVGDTYVIDWQNIHHMGETPTLYASSYYKSYYNNTNVLFVRAVWKVAEPVIVPPAEPEVDEDLETPTDNPNNENNSTENESSSKQLDGFTLGTIITLGVTSTSSITALIILLIKRRKA